MKQSSSEPLEEKPTYEVKFESEGQSYYNIFKDGSMWLGSVARSLAIEIVNKLNTTEKANEKISYLESELKALMEENERLKHWHNEKDEEADAERVSLAVAEIESEIQQATKEQENKFLSLLAENEALREERDHNKRLLTILVNQINALREERDQFAIDFLEEVSTEYRLDEGPVLGNVFYLRGQPGKEYTSKELLEQFKATKI